MKEYVLRYTSGVRHVDDQISHEIFKADNWNNPLISNLDDFIPESLLMKQENYERFKERVS